MAITKCPECGKDVSDEARACPSCGSPLRPRGTWVWNIIKVVFVAFLAVQAFKYLAKLDAEGKLGQPPPAATP